MDSAPHPVGFRHGLAFLALTGFLAGFLGARIFATLNPTVVVVQSGVHFHHFWYGLALLALSGWLGIVRRGERLDRLYALIYGLGAGFIGDEIGLLLTFGNYYSELTYVFLVGLTGFVAGVALLLKFGDRLKRDVLSIGKEERVVHVGLIVAGLSVLFFAWGPWTDGMVTAAVGVLLMVAGRTFEKRRRAMPGQIPIDK